MEYYDVVGLDPARVYRANVPDVVAMLRDPDVIPDVKRLADALDLYARAKAELGETYGLAKLHAMKFYTVCGAFQSVVNRPGRHRRLHQNGRHRWRAELPRKDVVAVS